MSTESGQKAEQLAAEYLEAQGLKIIDRNWRSRWAEIDIIARSKIAIHFVEVKFRRSDSAGAGLEYITADKIRRLKNAAAAWMADRHPGESYQIDVISVDGANITYVASAVEGN